ncbi:hypothetical protein B1H18_08895 [Streptomyces tsukubensis]|uniref:NAD(P)-binding domain-containing protein n=1 Tax=Streptomyces tsukubensis TaxID=83656 RepID=A0A1V4AC68_9ACTN|nr:GDP-mannose 4,6-dehydratase [Streptomyces tsukubensis]OON81421.1 hypothetical protein B1H18_08895 [Streptomyces tsukubensis]
MGLGWERYVRFDKYCLRPSEVNSLTGDASKAAVELGWKPKTFLPELASLMFDEDLGTVLAQPVEQ